MTEAHTDLKQAFARELAQFPPMPPLRFDTIPAAARRPADRPLRLEWLAVAAAVLVTAAILLSLVANRLAASSVPAGPPPAGVRVFYVIDARDVAVLDAYDWNGRLVGAVRMPAKLDSPAGIWAYPSPDGSAFVFQRRPGDRELLDRLGRRTAGVPDWPFLWSVDSSGVCLLGHHKPTPPPNAKVTLEANVFEGVLITETSAGQQTTRNEIKYLADSQSLRLAACDLGYGVVAITVVDDAVGTSGLPSFSTYSTIVGDGRGGLAISWRAPHAASVISAADGRYAAFNGDSGTEIWSVYGDGKAIPATVAVAFSGDDNLLLVDSLGQLIVEDWRTGLALWTHPDGDGAYRVFVQPGGGSFAISLPAGLTIVRSDGSTVRISGQYAPLW